MSQHQPHHPPLKILLASPRGFCAGVERAVAIVEQALEQHGQPIYVRHQIVHNAFVVESLQRKGVIFVDNLDDIPAHHQETRPIIFSAHGVAKAITRSAKEKKMFAINATCPLVEKVHREVERFQRDKFHILLIGHKHHPEVVGTMGQLTPNSKLPPITLIETRTDAENFIADGRPLAYVTQTTLSLDDTKEITDVLKRRFPEILTPKKGDICYATTNRQNAVKAIAPQCDMLLVLGAENSSNSMRLLEIAQKLSKRAILINDSNDLPEIDSSVQTLGITASASAPEILVQQTIESLKKSREVTLQDVPITRESVVFKMPKIAPKITSKIMNTTASAT